MPHVSPTSSPLSNRPTMLLVLGPGRSGTSLVTRLLECLGAKNSSNLMPANPGNPTGYFEDLDIYRFNEEVLLPHLGLKWYSLSFPDWRRLSASVREKLEQQALSIIEKNYLSLSSPLFILKEPRINMLLPFWLSVLERSKINVKIVSALRDPLSVAQSLRRQHGFSIIHGGMWYVVMWYSALASTKELPMAFIHFDSIFYNPLKTLQLIADQLHLALPNKVEEQIKFFTDNHLNSKLRHFRTNIKDLLLEPQLPLIAVKMYTTVLEAVKKKESKKIIKLIPFFENIFSTAQPLFKKFDVLTSEYYLKN